jgi:hypothetical protein
MLLAQPFKTVAVETGAIEVVQPGSTVSVAGRSASQDTVNGTFATRHHLLQRS